MDDAAPLAEIAFAGEVIEWRGPAPFHFVAIPAEHTGELRWAAREASYGWGVIPVTADIAGHRFTTSLFPRAGNYLLPLKDAVRKATGIALGDTVEVTLTVRACNGSVTIRPPRIP